MECNEHKFMAEFIPAFASQSEAAGINSQNKGAEMLKILRDKKTAKKIWIILAIIIVPAFVMWGFGGALRSKDEPAFAGKIFGKTVSILEYKDALDAVKNMAILRFGDKLSEVQKYLNLEAQAWERLILLHEAKKRRIRTTDKEIIELVESYPFFQHNGQFNDKLYAETLRYVFRTQPRTFEEQTRQNIMIAKLYNQITYRVKITDDEIRQEYKKLNQEISLYYIAGLPVDFAKNITPSNDEIKGYYDKSSLQFKQPLSFNMDYLAVDSEDRAKDIMFRLNKKDDLAKISKDLGIAVKETGLFGQTGPIPGIGWSPDVLSMISKLNIGQYTQPILSDKTYYILMLKEKKESYIPEFEQIKDKVKEAVVKEKSTQLAKEKTDECLKTLKELYKQNPKSADFDSNAKKFGLKSDSTKTFKFSSYIEGIGASDVFWSTGIALKPEEFSDIINMPGGYFIIKPKDIVAFDEKKFGTEKAEFGQKVLDQKRQEFFTQFTEELKRKAQL